MRIRQRLLRDAAFLTLCDGKTPWRRAFLRDWRRRCHRTAL